MKYLVGHVLTFPRMIFTAFFPAFRSTHSLQSSIEVTNIFYIYYYLHEQRRRRLEHYSPVTLDASCASPVFAQVPPFEPHNSTLCVNLIPIGTSDK